MRCCCPFLPTRFCAQASQSHPNPSQRSTISTACLNRQASQPALLCPQNPHCMMRQRKTCLYPLHRQRKHITSPISTIATQAPCAAHLNHRLRSKSNAAQRAALFILPASIHSDNAHHTNRAAAASDAVQMHAAFSRGPPSLFLAHPAAQNSAAFLFRLQPLRTPFSCPSIFQTRIAWIHLKTKAVFLPGIHSSRLYPLCMQTAAQSSLPP